MIMHEAWRWWSHLTTQCFTYHESHHLFNLSRLDRCRIRKTSISTLTEIIPHNESMSLNNVIISFCSSASAFDGVVYSRLVYSRVVKSKSSIPPALVSIRSTHASQNNENLSCSLLELAPPAFTYDTCKSIRMPSKSLLLRINAYTHKRGSNGTVARFVPSSLHT